MDRNSAISRIPPANVPLVAHVIHELGVGGLENGLVNLINHMPRARYRHAIVCMTRYTDFQARITRGDVPVLAMDRDGRSLWQTYVALTRLFRRLRPSIVHSRNLSGLDALLPALWAGVPIRVHGEHGRDVDDLDGSNRKNRILRRMSRPFVTQYLTVSKDIERYMVQAIGVPQARVTQVYNGVDVEVFFPRDSEHAPELPMASPRFIVGTVGRLQAVKAQGLLVKAFAHACNSAPEAMKSAQLIIVGDGPCRAQIEADIEREGLDDKVELLGSRNDVASLLRTFDLFVLPSLAEGISNTLLEAMATGLPVLATNVGGNPELVSQGVVGQLVSAGDWQAMASWIVRYASDIALRRSHGLAARERMTAHFSIDSMVSEYMGVYDRLMALHAKPRSMHTGVLRY